MTSQVMRQRRRAAMIALAVAAIPSVARATDRYYVGASGGSWNNASNWNTAEDSSGTSGVPAAGDNANIQGAVTKTIAFDGNYSAGNGLNQLLIDSDDALSHTLTLTQSSNTLITESTFIGYFGGGAVTQSGGSHTANQVFSLGRTGASQGSYSLSNGTLTGGFEYVGDGGVGTFTQTGGTHTVTAHLNLAYNPGSSGTYSMSGASSVLSVAGYEYVGDLGAATFNQSNGTHIVGTQAFNSDLYIGAGIVGSGTGEFNMTGGSLTVNGNVGVGGGFTNAGGVGSLNISAGTVSVTGTLKIWNTGSAAPNGTRVRLLGTGTLNVGNLDASGHLERLDWTAGTLNFTGATMNVDSTGPLGATPSIGSGKTLGATGTLAINSGGTLGLAGGTINAGVLDTGGVPSRLSWGTGTLNITNSTLNIDSTGPLGATPTITGGQTLGVSQTLAVNAGGTLTLSAGAVRTHTLNLGGVPSRFVWNSGALIITAPSFDIDSTCPLGASVTLGANQSLTVNNTLNINNGGTLSAASVVHAGTLNLVAGGTFNQTGSSGPVAQTLNQTGGSYTLLSGSVLSINTSAVRRYNLSGGQINSGASQQGMISISGPNTIMVNPARFHQTGGNLFVNSIFMNAPGGTGLNAGGYALDAGSMTGSLLSIGTGSNVAGKFIQNGGSVTFNQVNLGTSSATGTYTLNDGTFHSTVNLFVGQSNGTATFTQVAGTVTVDTQLALGRNAGGNGTYNLNGGTLNAADLILGFNGGTGTFNQTGGTFNKTGAMIIGDSGGTGTYNLSGGTLNDPTITINDGSFVQSGSSINNVTTLTVGAAGSYDLQSGTLNADTIQVDAGAEFISSGTVNVGNMVINGNALVVEGAGTTVRANTIGFTSGSKLDLTDNDLIITGMSRAAVESLVKTGFGNFDWNGTAITSSTAAAFAATDGSRSLGIIDNADWGHATFGGQTVSATDILVKYTWTGDANVDGLVDNDDFGQFLYGYNGGGAARWLNGDFDFSGTVDNDDFGMFLIGLSAFQASGNMQLSQDFKSHLAEFASANGVPLVLPEPAIGLAAPVILLTTMRRRRKNARI